MNRPGTPTPAFLREGRPKTAEPLPTAAPQAHCWVRDPEGDGAELPGVVLAWRRHPRGWQAQVTYVTHDGTAPVSVTIWLPADQLRSV